MGTIRIVVANELWSYRDVLAAALSCLRPEAQVVSVEPDELDVEIARLMPHLVLCSKVTAAVESVPGWVVLYPGHETRAEICIGGERQTVGDVQFDSLLGVVDSIKRHTRLGVVPSL